jgi:hypothetical protein
MANCSPIGNNGELFAHWRTMANGFGGVRWSSDMFASMANIDDRWRKGWRTP